jgi:hypothetical protein
MQALVTEFLRQATILPGAVVAREDWHLGQVGVHHYALLLYELLAESNQPLPPMGIKQWSSRLTEQQRAVLAGLPQPAATRAEVMDAMVAVRDVLVVRGRAAYESAGGEWHRRSRRPCRRTGVVTACPGPTKAQQIEGR